MSFALLPLAVCPPQWEFFHPRVHRFPERRQGCALILVFQVFCGVLLSVPTTMIIAHYC